MSWIETLQKVIPWAAGLSLAPKIVLSVIVSALNVLCLMLIWMPARKPAEAPPASETTLQEPHRGPAASPSHMAADALNAPTVRLPAFADTRYELARLKSILFDLIQLQASNAPFPSVLRDYVRRPDARSWVTVVMTSAKLAAIANELNQSLAAFKGDLIFEDIATYRSICLGLHDSQKLYELITSIRMPSTPDELVQLAAIATSYDGLIERMMRAQEALAQYALRKNRRRSRERYRDYESAVKILSALNHRWLEYARLHGAGKQWYEVPAENEYRFVLPFATPEKAAEHRQHHDVLLLAALPPGRAGINAALRITWEGSWLVLRVPSCILRQLAECAEQGEWPLRPGRKILALRHGGF